MKNNKNAWFCVKTTRNRLYLSCITYTKLFGIHQNVYEHIQNIMFRYSFALKNDFHHTINIEKNNRNHSFTIHWEIAI